MRIIAGEFRGRQIKPVPGDNTRPTTDKVKESVFNMLGQFFDGGRVLDLFAGSGNLGVEALSRGMDHALFIDMSPAAIKVIKTNIATLGIESRCEIYRNDAMRALSVLAKKEAQFDLLFLDPPYGKIKITELLATIVNHELLADNGMVMCEFDAGQEVTYDDTRLQEVRREVYGTIEVLILEKVGG